MQDKHRGRVTNGILWSAIERFSVQGIQFFLSIVIARLISPSDYGLIAMLSIFLAIAQQFVDSGFANALIQKKDRSDVDFSTVFYANLIIAVVAYAALYVAAPWIADFYSEPKLIAVTRWVGLTVVLMAFSIVQRAKLTIELDFKKQAQVSLVSVIISGICGILLAWKGYGVWALVVQTLVNNFVNSLLLWVFAHWTLRPVFSWTSFRSLFSFGSKLLVVGVLHVLYNNIYTVIIGKKYNASDVGFFNRSQTLANFPSFNISSVVCRAIYPEQCNLQSDRDRLVDSFLRYQRLLAYLVFPAMAMMAVLSAPLIEFVLSERWLPAAGLLPILCMGYVWTPVWATCWQIINTQGRSDLSLKVELICKTISLAVLVATIPFGLRPICYGLALSCLVDVIVIIPYVKKLVGVGYRGIVKNLRSAAMMASISAGVACLSAQGFSSPCPKVIVGAAAGLVSYVLLGVIFKIEEFRMLLRYCRR